MGEEVGVTIVAGGKVTRRQWNRFVKACDEAEVSFDLNHEGRLYLCDNRNYGNTDEERELLRSHGIAFHASSDAKYDVGASVHAWFPGMAADAVADADQEGRAQVGIGALVEARAAGKTLEDVIAGFEAFTREVPPMTIGRARATAADL